jgi:hypothetical protein
VVFELGTMRPILDVDGSFGSGAVPEVMSERLTGFSKR